MARLSKTFLFGEYAILAPGGVAGLVVARILPLKTKLSHVIFGLFMQTHQPAVCGKALWTIR